MRDHLRDFVRSTVRDSIRVWAGISDSKAEAELGIVGAL